MLKRRGDDSGLDKQSEKLLKDFFKKGQNLDKKWRSFHTFRESKSDSPQELAKFYADNFHVVFTLLQDGVAEFSAQAAKGKRDGKFLDEVIVLLQTIVQYLAELIGRQWQTKALADIICNLLYKENKMELRLRGFDIYMDFMSAVRMREGDWKELKDVVSMFGQCFLFQPFVPAGVAPVKFSFFPLEAPNDVAVWMPGGTTSEADGEAIFKRALEFISKKTGDDFVVWFRMLKENVFSVLFPKVCKQTTVEAGEDTGFQECPPKLLRFVVTSALVNWLKDPAKNSLIWQDASNAQLLLEIYSQSMAVGTSNADISIAVLGAFQSVFFSGKPPPEVESRLAAYRVYYLKRFAGVFSKPTDQGTLQSHKKLCQETLRMLNLCAQAEGLEKPALDLILALPLTGLNAVTKNQQLGVEVIREMTLTAIKRWVVMQPETSWKPLETVMQLTFGVSQQAIEAALDMWMQVTLVVQRFYYPSHVAKESKRKLGAAGQATADHFSRSPDWRPGREAPDPDPEITELPFWDAKSAFQTWTNLRNLYAGLTGISDSGKHCKAVEAVATMADYLIRQEAGIPFEALLQPSRPRPLELLDVFGPIFCEALSEGEGKAAGKAVGAGALCRLLCRKTDPVPLVVLQYFYAVVARQLEEEPVSPASFEIIANSGPIFSVGLPGVTDLIPYYLHAISLIFGSSVEVPDHCFRNCITVVASLICYPRHFKDLNVPVQLRDADLSVSDRSRLTAADLHNLIGRLLSGALAKAVRPEHAFLVMCGLTVSVMSDCRVAGPGSSLKKRVSESITKIIQQCSSYEPDIVTGALHCLATLAMDVDAVAAFDSNLPPLVVVGLSNVIIELLTGKDKKAQVPAPVVVAAFQGLEEWALSVPASVVASPSVNRALFAAIEVGIFGTSSAVTGQQAGGRRRGKDSMQSVTSMIGFTPAHTSKEVTEAAEVTLRAMLNLHSQWPGPGGAELTGTVLRENMDPEKDDTDVTYYYANGSIVSLVPQEERSVRLIVRDETDRYAWDATALFDDESGGKSLQPLPVASVSDRAASPAPRTTGISKRAPREPPTHETMSDGPGVDRVDELLKYLSERYDDCPYVIDTIDVADEIKPLVEQTARSMDEQEASMQSAGAASSHANDLVLPEPGDRSSDPNHWARLLLSHFSIVDYDQRAMFSMLERGAPLQRSINTLDTKRAREAFKIGLIYVKRGQDTQEQILVNETRSQYYDAFVKSLAREVNMATHAGYIGGLDTTKFLTGTAAPYYATPRLELMFHDITCMPTNREDPQQIHKKRHVGNDVVNVVFTEHSRDYNPATISTQFNCAHIIVYPLLNGLYRVQICRKEEQVYPLFGPLVHNMAVSADILPLLVRQTALNANRNFTSHKAGYLLPFPNRSKDVVQLLSRYKQDNSDYQKTVKAAFGSHF